MSDELVVRREGGVLVARLNRPEARNALNRALIGALGSAVIEAENDPDIRALILIGTGDRAFCSGLDLRDVAAGNTAAGTVEPSAMEAFRRLTDGDVACPVIGAANASAVAGGFELLLGCDLIVASSEAKFGLPEVKRGLFAAGGGTWLATRVPLAIAMELTLIGDTITAAQALGYGLVNAVVAPDQVLATALDYASRIAANGPLAVSATKELVRLAVADPALARQRHQVLVTTVFASEDAKEGATAFIEKRSPVWKGR